jgi:hypothetical protein
VLPARAEGSSAATARPPDRRAPATRCTRARSARTRRAWTCSGRSEADHWDLDLGEIARIWKGGCIIRARFLDRIKDAYRKNPALQHLLLDQELGGFLGLRRSRLAQGPRARGRARGPLLAMSASLAYFDSVRRARLPQNLTQAQRDFFGAHTFERVDAPARRDVPPPVDLTGRRDAGLPSYSSPNRDANSSMIARTCSSQSGPRRFELEHRVPLSAASIMTFMIDFASTPSSPSRPDRQRARVGVRGLHDHGAPARAWRPFVFSSRTVARQTRGVGTPAASGGQAHGPTSPAPLQPGECSSDLAHLEQQAPGSPGSLRGQHEARKSALRASGRDPAQRLDVCARAGLGEPGS